MNTKKWIIIHHTAVSQNDNHEQFEAVRNYHINKGWGDIGYHYFIEPDGKLVKGRRDDVAGAHCSQKFMNYKSIGICLTGNFDVEEPTEEQMSVLNNLVLKLKGEYDIPDSNIVGHRHFATYKSCPGDKFTTGMINSVAKNSEKPKPKISEWAQDSVKFMIINKIITGWKTPNSPVTKQELAVITKRTIDHILKQLKNGKSK